jgi:hypothetical protein
MDCHEGTPAKTVARARISRLIVAIKSPTKLLVILAVAWSTATAADFARTLSPEEIQQAGLAKLSPEELGRLETLIERYKTGVAVPAPVPVASAPAATTKTNKNAPSWLHALVAAEGIGKQAEKPEALESSLKGDFEGWNGRTVFRLVNGQLWIQANSENYVHSPTLKSPKVKIYPASLGGYWLEIEGVKERCRIKPSKL